MCDRVISLQPDHVEAWALKGAPPQRSGRRKPIDPKEWRQVVEPRAMAVALSWKALYRAEWEGSALEKPKSLAYRCLVNLSSALGTGEGISVAAPILQQAINLDDTNARAFLQLGSTYQKAKRHREAAAACFEVLRIQGVSAGARLLGQLAKVLIELGNQAVSEKRKGRYREEATRIYRLAKERSLLGKSILADLATAYDLGGEEQQSAGSYSSPMSPEASEETNRDPEATVKHALRYARKGTEKREKGQTTLASCLFDKAQDTVSNLTNQELRDQGAFSTLDEFYRGTGNTQEALRCVQKAVELNPADNVARKRLAGTYRELGDYERAEYEWQICLDLEPEDLESLNGIADTYWNRGALISSPVERSKDLTRVMEIFNRTLDLSDEWESQAKAHYWLGCFHSDQLHYDQAVYHFNIVKGMNFGPIATRFYLGETYLEIESWDNAENEFREARRRIVEHVKQSRKKKETRNEALSKLPDSSQPDSLLDLLIQIYLCRAMMCAERRVNLKQGLRFAMRTRSLIKSVERSKQEKFQSWQYECLGAIMLQQGQVDTAITNLERAIALGSEGFIDEGGGYYRLAKAYVVRARNASPDSAQWLDRARQRCEDAAQASIRGVYKEEIDRMRREIDSFEAKQTTAQPPSGAVASKDAA